MTDRQKRFFSLMFLLGALWNVSIGITGCLFYRFSAVLFFGDSVVTEGLIAGLFFRLLMVAVLIFGVGYYLVSRELTLNRGIVWLGLASKLILFTVFTWLFLAGKTTIMAQLALTGDLVWSVFFARFLYLSRDTVRTGPFTG